MDSLADGLTKALNEGWGEFVDPRMRFNDAKGFGWLSHKFGFYTTIDMRADGRHAPVYDNEFDLKAIRWASWLLDETVPTASVLKRRLIDYTISGGFDWTVTHDSPRIEQLCKQIIDAFLRNSQWVDLERQSFDKEFVDGEFLAEFSCDGMDVAMEILEGDQLQEPANKFQLEEWKGIDFPASWSFGILTKQNRTRPIAYHVVRDEAGADWDLVPARQFVHWKRNAPLRAKRGYSDHYLTHKIVNHGAKVLERTAIGSAIQASIAYIVEHAPNTSASKVSDFANSRPNIVTRTNTLGETERTSEISAGKILDIKSGQKYQAGLLGANASTIYIQVMEACLRIAGTPYAMPEHFLTGYAGNNNLASSLTAQDPFIQGRLADQQVRADRLEQLLKNAVRYCLEHCGHKFNLDADDISKIIDHVDIAITKPEIVSKPDTGPLVNSLIAQMQNKLITRKGAIQQLGYDYDAIENELKHEEEEAAAKQQQAGGMPGQPGQPGQEHAPQQQPGGLSQLGRRQFTNNSKAINDIEGAVEGGEMSRAKGIALLGELGLSKAAIEAILPDDQQDGQQDPEEPTHALATPLSRHGRTAESISAEGWIKKLPTPKTPEQYRDCVRIVAEEVASEFNIPPLEALTEAINPMVFLPWKFAATALQPIQESQTKVRRVRQREQPKPTELAITVSHSQVPIDVTLTHQPIEFAPIQIREAISQAPAPAEVHCNPVINVNVPQQPPATVDVTVNPAEVILPERKTSTVIDRDENGLISRVTQTEKDIDQDG